MISAWILCTCLVASGPDGQPAVHPKKAESESQVKQALQAEAKGLDAERLTHLARAIALDPGNALARGLMGLVEYQGRWQRSETVEAKVRADDARAARVREYLERRAKTLMRADSQVKLAEWCEQNHLTEQAQAHYRLAVRLDPSRELAWRRLGYKRQGRHWVHPDEEAARKAEADAQKKANADWQPRMVKIREGLLAANPAAREAAERQLAAITDRRATPSIMTILATGNERLQLDAVQALGQLDGQMAVAGLAQLAVFSDSAAVRSNASATLVRRDTRSITDGLIGLVRRPFKYEVIPATGPGTSAQLLVDGEAFDVQKSYRFPVLNVTQNSFWVELTDTKVVDDGFAQPDPRRPSWGGRPPGMTMGHNAQNLQRAQATARAVDEGSRARAAETGQAITAQNEFALQAAQEEFVRRTVAVHRSIEDDIRMIDGLNDQIGQINARVLPVLASITGRDLGADPDGWRRWSADQQGYVSSSEPTIKPTYSEVVAVPDVTLTLQAGVTRTSQITQHVNNQFQFTPVSAHDCFAAGTIVHTIDGPRSIESIRVGDLVLSQDTAAGSMTFRPVTDIHHSPPMPTLRVAVGDETFLATGIHRFWKVGEGWVMARDLKPGDRLRRVGSSAVVRSVEPDAVVPVFNLDVDSNRNFFVGEHRFLVHDFSLVLPVDTPFDGLRNAHQVPDSN
ncbi:polymorphic toxin-type HINT domain-containing protein [Aquisphaera insulae]|uniref:polymorphic toxin-type HINT domain-containing protein n=1 Tax=Aquisphaera insulae TaxID=2712864 RepID=UPI0013EA2536|nr:polymorphic toxin-type HINT domain-containing protein [Aquisphaera insulae]